MKKVLFNYINIIQNAITSNKLILFVGSGVSINSGIPSWKDLIQELSKDLCIKNKNTYTFEEMIKIPQLYFNKFGKGSYNNKIKSILQIDKAKPNIINDLLFDLNPQYIITTNYDSLIEDSAKKQKEFFSLVKQDKDFPKTNNNKMIIKMHGDIPLGNFVLKEDDYKNYSKNFILTETYIKGLFSTHVILFVGYSISDPNVKQIFNWINEILGEDSTPAFLIDIDKTSKKGQILSKNEEKDLLPKRIFKLKYSEFEAEIKKNLNKQSISILKNNKAKQLYKFLTFIKNYENKSNIIEYFYNKLSILEPFNFVPYLIFSKFLNIEIGIRTKKYIGSYTVCSQNSDFKKLILELRSKEKYLNVTKKLIKIFNICGIEMISHNNFLLKKMRRPTTFSIPEFQKLCISEDILTFNYNKLLNEIYDEQDYLKNHVDVLKKAYILFSIGRDVEAYKELESVSYKAQELDHYVIYALAEINKLIIANDLSLNNILYSSKYNNEVDKEVKLILDKKSKINIKKLVDKILPTQYSIIFKDLQNYNFFFNIFILLSERDSRIQNSYLKMPDCFDCLDYMHLCNIFNEFYIFIQNNYMLFNAREKIGVDICKNIFYIYIDSTLKSYCIKDKKKSFDYDNDIFIMVKHIKPDELSRLLNKYHIEKINLEDEKLTKKKIINSFTNLVESIKSIGTNNNELLHYYNNFLLIFSKLTLTKQELKYVINSFINNYIDYRYIENLIEKNVNIITIEDIKRLIIFELKQLTYKKSGKNQHSYDEESFLFFLIKTLKIKHAKLYLNSESNMLLVDYIEKLLKFDFNGESLCKMLLLYSVFNATIRKKIKLHLINLINSNFEICFYYHGCMNGVIEPSMIYENKVFEKIANEITKEKDRAKVMNSLDGIANLINHNLIINREKLKEFLGISHFFDFIFDMKKFNYQNFNLKFLLIINGQIKSNLIQFLKNNTDANKIMRKKYREFNPDNLDIDEYNRIKNIIMEII